MRYSIKKIGLIGTPPLLCRPVLPYIIKLTSFFFENFAPPALLIIKAYKWVIKWYSREIREYSGTSI